MKEYRQQGMGRNIRCWRRYKAILWKGWGSFMLANWSYGEEVFTEQAEYINSRNLENWHMQHQNEKLIMKKLCQGGAKLLTGPRGCGKTTLLLKAYNEMRHRKDVFSIYVNFKTPLKIAPLYSKKYQWPLLV